MSLRRPLARWPEPPNRDSTARNAPKTAESECQEPLSPIWEARAPPESSAFALRALACYVKMVVREMAESFTVNTHVFRELGQLLVGRDSTALVELIKNSYDADATTVTVFGQGLADPTRGYILVADSGSGMSETVFREGFLRIASRLKEAGDRRSLKYCRRFTGAKGIGRLAAHKLARVIQVSSIAQDEAVGCLTTLDAHIDWDRVEKSETIDRIEPGAIVVSTGRAPVRATTGTTIRLSKLRSPWRPEERGRFLAEVQGFSPPPVLMDPIPASVLEKPLLFEQPVARESGAKDPGFHVVLEGEFATGEEYWATLAEASSWIVEIDSRKDGVDFGVAPTRSTRKDNPEARRQVFSIKHPNPDCGPFFQSRILVREGSIQGLNREQRGWAGRAFGVRVFMEGFRVLPYGEPGDDWLSLDAAYTARSRSLELLATEFWEKAFASTQDDPDRDLAVLYNKQYFGAVLLTQQNAPGLRMVVNREGFIPDRDFQILRDLVRTGIDVSTRVRASASHSQRIQRRNERAAPRAEPRTFIPNIPSRTRLIHEARSLAASQRYDAAYTRMAEAVDDSFMNWLNDSSDQMAMLRITASVGTQMAAFVHELNGLLGMAQAIEQAVDRLREGENLTGSFRSSLARIGRSAGDLR